MSRASNTDQFKFLISCIRWSNGGRVNFGEVAAECDIVSKGAAAKRYERMMKSHGIGTNSSASRSPTSRDVKSERGKRARQPPAKKRKIIGDFSEDQSTQDDDENFIGNVKQDPGYDMEDLIIKEETEDLNVEEDNVNDMIPFPVPNLGAMEGYDSSGSLYEPSTGYNIHGNDFASSIGSAHMFDLPGPSVPFTDFSRYQNVSDIGSAGTITTQTSHYHAQNVPTTQKTSYLDEHIIITD